jgi:hypothetical protein
MCKSDIKKEEKQNLDQMKESRKEIQTPKMRPATNIQLE